MIWHLKRITAESFQSVKCFYSVYKDNCFFYSVCIFCDDQFEHWCEIFEIYLCFKHLFPDCPH